jgi:hypothetical protein
MWAAEHQIVILRDFDLREPGMANIDPLLERNKHFATTTAR